MTKEEAIQILSTRDAHGVLCGYTNGVTEALDMAIEALKEEPKSKVIAQINVDADEIVKLIEQNCNWKRPKGYWIIKHIETTPKFVEALFCCSECGEGQVYGMPNYCPSCGADMRKVEDD